MKRRTKGSTGRTMRSKTIIKSSRQNMGTLMMSIRTFEAIYGD